MLARLFCARSAVMTLQRCVELIERIVLAAADFLSTFEDSFELGLGGSVDGYASRCAEIHSERLAHQFALGALLQPAGPFDLPAHLLR
jgi:hypothetical protein